MLTQAVRLVTLVALVASTLVTATPAYAAPGPCDGTPANDPPITCSTDPTPDDQVGLGLGDDTYVQDAGVTSDYVGGDADEDGLESSGNGGNDHITINGIVTSCVDGDNVDGDGGNDTIIINGEVQCEVAGDYAGGNGGDDTITINGEVHSSVSGDIALLDGGDDIITINGDVGGDVYGDESGGDGGNDRITLASSGTIGGDVYGDSSGGNGGNDTITINGVVAGDIYGDWADGDGGNDTIVINGTVAGDIYADAVLGTGGDDRVELGAGANVGGIIYGEDGFDTLVFTFLLQNQLNGLDPAGDSLTHNGQTYTWANFERLLGTLIAALKDSLAELLFAGSGFTAADVGGGIMILRGDMLIAFAPHTTLRSLAQADEPFRLKAEGQGWYVTMVNLGSTAEQPYRETMQVTIFSPAGDLAAQFMFLEQ